MLYLKCLKKVLLINLCGCKHSELEKLEIQINQSKWLGGWGESEKFAFTLPLCILGAELKGFTILKSVNPK